MRGHHVGLFTVIGSLLSTLALAQAPSYTFTNLDVPFPNAENGTFAEGINDRSQVVGIYVEFGGAQHGFIEDRGKYTTLDVPGASHTRLFGINNHGEIVGDYTKGTRSHGFLYTRGRFTNLDVPGAVFTSPIGINDRGQVVGFYEDGKGRSHGFLYERGRFRTINVPFPGAFAIELSGINNRGHIAGCYRDSTGGHGLLYAHGPFTSFDVPFAETFDTCALGINDHGHIVGLYQNGMLDHPTGVHGFVYEEGEFTTIDVPDFLTGVNPQVNGINNRRQIVGFYAVLHEPRFSSFIATPTEDIASQ
jgi:probable HAF family extracellular repeat protein